MTQAHKFSILVYAGIALFVGYQGYTWTQEWWWGAIIGLLAFCTAWVLVYLFHVVRAGPAIYYSERDKADELEERLKPRINADLNPNTHGVREEETWNQAAGVAGPFTKWVQIEISPIGDAPLVDCEVRVARAERLVAGGKPHTILDEPLHCIWSNTEEKTLTVPAKVTHSANLFTVMQGKTKLRQQTIPKKVGFQNALNAAGTYRLHIRVSARDAPTKGLTLLMVWGGRYEELSLEIQDNDV